MTLGNETKMATRTGKRSILTILQKKIGDCEQSIDTPNLQNNVNTIWQITHEKTAKQRSATNFRQSSTHFKIPRPDFQ